jgi:hypothetical protein
MRRGAAVCLGSLSDAAARLRVTIPDSGDRESGIRRSADENIHARWGLSVAVKQVNDYLPNASM